MESSVKRLFGMIDESFEIGLASLELGYKFKVSGDSKHFVVPINNVHIPVGNLTQERLFG